MSASLYDDRDISAVPAAEFVPHHYLSIPAVVALPAGDPDVRAAVVDWLRTNTPSPVMVASLQESGFADLLRTAS